MKHVLTALLALCFAVMAGPALAMPPVLGFIQGVVAGLSGTALLGGTVGAAGFIGGVVASTYIGGTLLGRLALTVGINAVYAAATRPRLPSPQEGMVNRSQPLTYMQRVYGRVRKGGPVGFTGFKHPTRHYAIIIAAHRTKGPVAHWLDTFEVLVDGAGDVTTVPVMGYGNIRTYRGLPGQAVDPFLDAAFPEITSAHNFAGLSYAAILAHKPAASAMSEVLPQGREWAYAPVWDGWDEIYDPRSDTYGWTDNAALILAHEALFHGKTVDWDLVAIEADFADELVTNGDGGSQKRWTLNIALDDNVTWEQARDTLGRAVDAFFYETVFGQVGFYLGRYIAPDVTLTARDFLQLSIADKSWGPDVSGEAVIRYVEPAQDYQQATSGAIVADPGARRLEDELWAISSHNQACRIGARQLKAARARYTLQGTIKLIGYELIGKRFFRLTLADPSLDAVFEINRLIRNGDGMTFSIEAASVEATDWDFNGLTDEPPRPAREEVASDNAVPAISGLAGAAVTGTGGVAQIEWTWPAQDASLTQVLRSRVSGTTEWQEVQAGEGQSSLIATGLIDGVDYEAQIRNRTVAGRVGEWSSTITVTAIANSVAPTALTAFAVAVAGGTTGAVTFTAPNSPNYAASRIWRGTTATFGSASLVRTEYGAPSVSDGWDDAGLTTGTYYYWAAPINGSGISGPVSGPETITII